METKKITFIIPTYNGEKYIKRCVESVLNQKKFDINAIEILLLDDGSGDNTHAIAQQYMEAHPDIVKASKHKNIGVARTRNKGIRLAQGEYVAFIDQDDYIDEDFCSVLYEATAGGAYDVVFSGMKRPDVNGKIVSKDVYKNTEFARLMCMSVWAKLHKTSFLRQHNIELFDNKQGEDIAFTFNEFQQTEKMIGLSYCGYNWFYNSNSVSNTGQRGLTDENIAAILRLQNRLFEIDKKDNDLTMFFITMLSAYYIFFSGRGSSRSEFLKGVEMIMGNLHKHRPNYVTNHYLLNSPRGIHPIFSIGVKCFIILFRFRLLKLFAIGYCRGND